MAIDYIKTGEDNKYDYYRNDSEVFSSEDNTYLYSKVLQERKEFYVKFNQEEKKNEQLEIKKKTLDRIMVLSECEPEEQVLFSLHKVVDKNRARTYSLSDPSKANNDVKLRGHKTKLNKKKKEENAPTQEKPTVLEVNNNPPDNNQVVYNNNVEKAKNDVVNIPENNSDDDVAFAKPNALSGVITVSLSPAGVIAKWFYLLISACGIAELVYFIIVFVTGNIKITPYLYYLLGIGVLLLVFGVFGFIQINSKKYNNCCLIIICIICIIFGIGSFIFSRFEEIETVRDNWIITILVSSLIVVFSSVCAILTNKLRKEHLINKNVQLEELIDSKE